MTDRIFMLEAGPGSIDDAAESTLKDSPHHGGMAA
jgi:hypothetical protein